MIYDLSQIQAESPDVLDMQDWLVFKDIKRMINSPYAVVVK